MRYARDGYSVESAITKRRPLPDWYLDRPAPIPGSEFFTEAYRDLVTCRSVDGPIPWTACHIYAQHKGLAPDVTDALWEAVRRMDLAERIWRVENPDPE
jgi:hypothetical protein